MELTAEQMLDYLLELNRQGFDLKNLYFVYREYNDEMRYYTDERIEGPPYIDGIDIHLN
jgi:hypothetical protein